MNKVVDGLKLLSLGIDQVGVVWAEFCDNARYLHRLSY